MPTDQPTEATPRRFLTAPIDRASFREAKARLGLLRLDMFRSADVAPITRATSA